MVSVSGYNGVLNVLLAFLCQTCARVLANGQPEMEQAELQINMTYGRSAILPCMISTMDTSSNYQVVWMNPRKQTISYGTNLINSDRRFSILRPYPSDWNLKISAVRQSDSGRYVCSVNTKPVQKKSVFLHVQVPPRITISSNMAVTEGHDLRLYCNVTGSPAPSITWYRDGAIIKGVHEELLLITNIKRGQAGIYQCVATNNVDPDASRDVEVDVEYAPFVTASSTRIGQMLKKETVLECQTEMNPQGTSIWRKGNKEIRMSNWKYEVETFTDDKYGRTMSLRIRSLDEKDFGKYTCEASNSVGRDDATIELYNYEVTTPRRVTTPQTALPPARSSRQTTSGKPPSTSTISKADTILTTARRRTSTASISGATGAYVSGKDKENVIVVMTDPSPPKSSSSSVHIGFMSLYVTVYYTLCWGHTQ